MTISPQNLFSFFEYSIHTQEQSVPSFGKIKNKQMTFAILNDYILDKENAYKYFLKNQKK